ncbi:hypothetical protein OS493_021837 [Desmophyllum pertusum]|uniref:Uncharacterized protein n=1 Tax=Desmophyllum pertusum TaxID=174260 RepID=A0A9W9ZN40_9CNID|nr:hypothetical protein OS493_021837 [Desmophyllum pertusum]
MVLQLAYSIFGICGGPLLGVFLLGMFVRRANAKGAYAGVFTGASLTAWVFLGSVFYPPNKYPGTTSVRECQFYKDAVYYNNMWTNASTRINVTAEQYNTSMQVFDQYGDGYIYNPHKPHGVGIADDFYHISYLWFSTISIFTSFLVGVVVSFAFETKEDREREIDPKLPISAKGLVVRVFCLITRSNGISTKASLN